MTGGEGRLGLLVEEYNQWATPVLPTFITPFFPPQLIQLTQFDSSVNPKVIQDINHHIHNAKHVIQNVKIQSMSSKISSAEGIRHSGYILAYTD